MKLFYVFVIVLAINGLCPYNIFAQAVEGISDSDTGVKGTSTFGYGVFGSSNQDYGVVGQSISSSGIYGVGFNLYGVRGSSIDSFGIYGSSANSHGAFFQGNHAFADIVLGGSPVFNDNGVISSDPAYSSSDIVITSNHNIVMELDNNGGETGVFEIWDSEEDVILRLQEDGLFEIWNGANGANNRRLQLDVNGNLAIDGTLTEGSDRNRKENILPVNNYDVLQKLLDIPVSTWNYVGESTPHLGPMAQDFYQAFQLGTTNKGIAGVDMQGVLLAAMQAQQEIMSEQQAMIQKQQTDIKLIQQEMAILKQLISEK